METHVGYTKSQGQAIVRLWNSYAKPAYQLECDQACLIMKENDNFDEEIIENGYAVIEVPARESNTGNPITFDIEASNLNITVTPANQVENFLFGGVQS
tara:strand:+ start:1551 stop:1847 length:297 start_codon:yes stop_codon:yes gene_type:complete